MTTKNAGMATRCGPREDGRPAPGPAAEREPVAGARGGRGAWILSGLPAVLAVLVYLDALGNPLVYDDVRTIGENASIRELGSVRAIVLHDLFRPALNFSYGLDRALWGPGPLGHHLTSVLLHALNALLLFRLAHRVAADSAARRPGRVGAGAPRSMALTAAALFAVHPMMTEAVGYVSGRAEVLCGTFFLLTLLAARRGLTAATAWARRGWLGAALGLWVLALASKETAVVLPLVLLAYDRLLLGGPEEARRERLWRVHLPLLAATAVAGAARLFVFIRFETQPPPVPVWQYLLMELGVTWRYLGLLVAPLSQSVVHSVREVTTPLDPAALVAGAGLVALGVLAARVRRRAPLVTFGAVWFLLALAPSSSLVPLGEAMAEHRVYLASVGFFVAVAALSDRAAGALRARGVLASRLVPRLALAGLVATLGLLTVARNLVWADPVTLWRDATRKAPATWLPWYALGDALRVRDDCEAAIPAYEAARRLRPQEPLVYANLGACLMVAGRLADADQVFSAGLRVAPTSARLQNGAGVLALRRSDPLGARRHFLAAVAANPGYGAARRNLAALDAVLDRCREPGSPAARASGGGECFVAPGEGAGSGRP